MEESTKVMVHAVNWLTGETTDSVVAGHDFLCSHDLDNDAANKLYEIITRLDTLAQDMDTLSHNKHMTQDLQQMLRVYARMLSSIEDEFSGCV